ncbi:hypothetical protein B0T21DRAFT_38849 [Apiosordaria backusii]|uniref:Uncharacterized protein n=1 Tax=Apiosordaria backusii TaxID=314023 RepID=A0AA40B2Z8_9PEZI|nr:hypothetical protein B0T21DRAFT_38849 [Apiosordaria backusii]
MSSTLTELEKLVSTLVRSNRLKLALSKSEERCEILIRNLRTSNSDLSRLREQRQAQVTSRILHSGTSVDKTVKSSPTTCPNFHQIRKTICDLHISLVSTYHTPEKDRPLNQHTLKLFLGSSGSTIETHTIISRVLLTCHCHLKILDKTGHLAKLVRQLEVRTTGNQQGVPCLSVSELPPLEITSSSFASLEQLIEAYDARTHLSIIDQLTLAKNTVVAALSLQQTPWGAGEYWRLEHLNFLLKDQSLPKVLNSLHFNSKIDNLDEVLPGNSTIIRGGAPEVLLDSDVEEAMLRHGIRCLTLFSVGTILLQIERWDSPSSILESDVEKIRRISRQTSRFGREYQKLVLKCIWCDFGCGLDSLLEPELQAAVWDQVVCVLSDMIDILGRA